MQLFVAFYGLAVLTGLRLDPWPAVALAFTLYAAAFLGDIWRGTLEAIPRTQWEAATALGLHRWRVLRHVILPQAARIAIPPTVGFLVQLIKNTSVAAIVGFVELTRAGQLMVNVTFQPMVVYPLVAALYFALCYPISFAAGRPRDADRRPPGREPRVTTPGATPASSRSRPPQARRSARPRVR